MGTVRSPTSNKVLDKRLPPGCRLDTHVHQTDSLTLILDGELREQFGSLPLRCPRWHLLYKGAGTPHTSEASRDGTRMLILTHPRPAAGEPTTTRDAAPRTLPAGSLSALALSLLGTPDSGARGGRAPATRVLCALYDRLRGDTSRAPDWIQETAHRIAGDPGSVQSLSPLAASLPVHRVHLARVFREYLGCSVGAFIRRCRVDAAVVRLIQSDIPLCMLALDLGFHDQSHFSKQFLRETGSTPARFRRVVRGLQAT